MNRTTVAERHAKIQLHHRERAAYVYVRQSSPRQVVEHLESRRRQYARVDWALAAGWPRERIVVIDEDQGTSAATAKVRPGFARLVSAVARGEVGIVIALEVSRLARNSPDWHHLLYLCRFSDTLIADEHAVYDPELGADRMVLGIRGQMGEMELDSSIERMVNARWSKAERGELCTIPPAGYELDELGQWVMSSDEAVVHALRTVFAKFDELGSGRQVLHWWQAQALKYPVRRLQSRRHPVVWLEPSYGMILRTLHTRSTPAPTCSARAKRCAASRARIRRGCRCSGSSVSSGRWSFAIIIRGISHSSATCRTSSGCAITRR